jgi:hypothetical protein
LVAKGLNPHGGAEFVAREPGTRRGLLVSASSMTFSGSLLVDEVCSRIARNALARALDSAS